METWKTDFFLEAYWKDASFRKIPAIFLEDSWLTGWISIRIRSDFRGFGESHMPGSFQEGCWLPASFLAGGSGYSFQEGRQVSSWKDPVNILSAWPPSWMLPGSLSSWKLPGRGKVQNPLISTLFSWILPGKFLESSWKLPGRFQDDRGEFCKTR